MAVRDAILALKPDDTLESYMDKLGLEQDPALRQLIANEITALGVTEAGAVYSSTDNGNTGIARTIGTPRGYTVV